MVSGVKPKADADADADTDTDTQRDAEDGGMNSGSEPSSTSQTQTQTQTQVADIIHSSPPPIANGNDNDNGNGLNPPPSPAPAAAPPPPALTRPYTTFTRRQIRLLTLLIGLATTTSPLTATIYLPLLPLLRSYFAGTSAQSINLTLTIYIVFQALSPALFGPLSDSLGRRPVYLFTLSLYVVANVGLAVNRRRYGVLLALRALQSLGASAGFAVSYGVVADVCVPSERGRVLGPVSMGLNLGACVGPVVGGWVAWRSGSYEWVFWVLVIVGAVLLLGVGALLPETMRSVVGNGNIDRKEEVGWWAESWYGLCRDSFRKRRRRQDRHRHESESDEKESKDTKNPGVAESGLHESFWQRCRIRNPLACLRIIFHLDTFLVLWMHGSFYTVDYSLVAAVPQIYHSIYHFNELQIGLAYLPRGAGIISGGYCVGKAMDFNYKSTARQIGWTVDSVSGDNIDDFPIEKARSRGSFWLLIVSTATLVSYGWVISRHSHVSIPLILQFVQGFWGTCFYTTYNTLLVDVFPQSPSTAAAAASIVRCVMAATGVALLQPLLDAAGLGWYFTVLGLWSGVFGALAVWLIRTRGMRCRTCRIQRSRQKASVNEGS